MKTGLITHPIYLKHDTGPSHPERPERIKAILKELTKDGIAKELVDIEPTLHAQIDQAITQVHEDAYCATLDSSIPNVGLNYLDPDTPVGPHSLQAAKMAVSGVLTAIDKVMDGSVQNAFCAVRPPGHHAEPDRAMGFCLFNNVAIGARYVQRRYGIKRVLIVDWDVHHGNGTQNIFYDDATVFYFSTHQFPFYPGTGSAEEMGVNEGEGATLNCPLNAGDGDKEILSKFEKELVPAAEKFKPEFIFISAGFDAHRDDPLAQLEVTEAGFERLTDIVKNLAHTFSAQRIVSTLEGGYNLKALAHSVNRHLTILNE